MIFLFFMIAIFLQALLCWFKTQALNDLTRNKAFPYPCERYMPVPKLCTENTKIIFMLVWQDLEYLDLKKQQQQQQKRQLYS